MKSSLRKFLAYGPQYPQYQTLHRSRYFIRCNNYFLVDYFTSLKLHFIRVPCQKKFIFVKAKLQNYYEQRSGRQVFFILDLKEELVVREMLGSEWEINSEKKNAQQ